MERTTLINHEIPSGKILWARWPGVLEDETSIQLVQIGDTGTKWKNRDWIRDRAQEIVTEQKGNSKFRNGDLLATPHLQIGPRQHIERIEWHQIKYAEHLASMEDAEARAQNGHPIDLKSRYGIGAVCCNLIETTETEGPHQLVMGIRPEGITNVIGGTYNLDEGFAPESESYLWNMTKKEIVEETGSSETNGTRLFAITIDTLYQRPLYIFHTKVGHAAEDANQLFNQNGDKSEHRQLHAIDFTQDSLLNFLETEPTLPATINAMETWIALQQA